MKDVSKDAKDAVDVNEAVDINDVADAVDAIDMDTAEARPKRKRVKHTQEELAIIRAEKEKEIRESYPRCRAHPDCHAWEDGRCVALRDNNFGRRGCPFYKNREVNRKEQGECLKRLIESGKSYLVEEYRKTFEYLGIYPASDDFAQQTADELERFSQEVWRELEEEDEAGGANETGACAATGDCDAGDIDIDIDMAEADEAGAADAAGAAGEEKTDEWIY